MSPTVEEFQDLFFRGGAFPVIMTLGASIRNTDSTGSYTGFVVGEPSIFIAHAQGLELRRGVDSLHLLRDGNDVLRANVDTCWVFENAGERIDPPIQGARLNLMCPSALSLFLHSKMVIPRSLLIAHRITQGNTAGRDTWVLSREGECSDDIDDHVFSMEIDQEHGTLLAVETPRERITADEVSFPDTLDDPSWKGPSRSPREPVVTPLNPADVPGLVADLPPQSTDSRRLRVFISEIELEGSFPDYHIGQSIRLPLGLSPLPEPVAGLSTVRRGQVRNLGEQPRKHDGFRWKIMLTGDGWTALTSTPIPVIGDTEVEGWFFYSTFGYPITGTDVRIERVFAGIGSPRTREQRWQEVESTSQAYSGGDWWARDFILDVCLDDAVPPPINRSVFHSYGSVTVNGYHWMYDAWLPVARCWDTATGRYLGQTVIPAPMQDYFPVIELHSDDALGVIASSGSVGWRLAPGEAIAQEAPSWRPRAKEEYEDFPVPAPWEVTRTLQLGFCELMEYTNHGTRTALARLDDKGKVKICQLPSTGLPIDSIVNIGNEFVVTRWCEEYHLTHDLEIISSQAFDLPGSRWGATEQVTFSVNPNEVSFFNQYDGAHIVSLPLAEDSYPVILSATPGRITVLIELRSRTYSWEMVPGSISIYSDGSWTTHPLEEAPPEVFGESR